MSQREQDLEKALRVVLDSIDAAQVKPAFDREWVESLLRPSNAQSLPVKRIIDPQWVKDTPFTLEDLGAKVDEICGCAAQYNCNCTSILNKALGDMWYDHNSAASRF